MINGTLVGGGWLFGGLIAAGVVLLIVLVVRLIGGGIKRAEPGDAPESAAPPADGPRQLLDARFANGDLTTEDYRERIRILDGGS